MDRLSDAAQARAQGVAERWHRPSERRASEVARSGASVRATAAVEVRAKDDDTGKRGDLPRSRR